MAIRCFQLLGVVTHPDDRRRGYATVLCAALMRHIHTQGARHAVLFTGIENTPAQHCYQRLGFQITSDHLMAKSIPLGPA